MRIAVTGSTGLIGSALVASLRADGHDVLRLVRRKPGAPTGSRPEPGTPARSRPEPGAPARSRPEPGTPTGSRPEPGAVDEARWDPAGGQVDTGALEGCDAVVNLAGAGVGDKRWTPRYKQEIRDSRVLGTGTLARSVAGLAKPPRVLVNGSAIGYYGDTGDRRTDETAPPGEGFLAGVCREWEAATAPAEQAGIRVAHARTGLVVARGGGAWGRLFPIFMSGLGGRMGSGRQYWSFISLADHIAALRHLITTPSLSGPVNLTAPEPVTNREVTAAMGRVLHRPTLATVPAPVLTAVLGEFAEGVLGSQRVVPRRLLDSGFTFTHPRIEDAIRAALEDGRR